MFIDMKRFNHERLVPELIKFGKLSVNKNGQIFIHKIKIARWGWNKIKKRIFDRQGDEYRVMGIKTPYGWRNVYSHRVIWQVFNGDIQAGMQVNHKNGIKTDNRLENLELVTASENQKHAYRVLGRKNNNIGEANNLSKLKEYQVMEIFNRVKSGEKQGLIAKDFNVTRALICQIGKKKIWKHILP